MVGAALPSWQICCFISSSRAARPASIMTALGLPSALWCRRQGINTQTAGLACKTEFVCGSYRLGRGRGRSSPGQ
jgi:hypothetical protein